MMNNRKKIIACGVVLAVFFITSCGEGYSGDYKNFPYDLRGTWVLHELDPDYEGELIISSDRITIKDFNRGQTPWWGDDNDRPFKSFTKNVALKGYSEEISSTKNSKEGEFFIEDWGLVQEGIPYKFQKAGIYQEIYLLQFTFGNNTITMRRE
jgi:hypothetical protein